MTATPRENIRELLLQIVNERQPKNGRPDGSLQQGAILREAASRLNIVNDPDLELAVLSLWNGLFQTGYLAWGMNLSNPDPPFFHITERGKHGLARLSRDPGNPVGYQAHVTSLGQLNSVAASYLSEALACYVAALHKAAAVMLGAASESIVLELRDAVATQLAAVGTSPPKALQNWQVKTLLDGLKVLIDRHTSTMPSDLRVEYEAYWSAFTQQIRSTRNDAGHPTSVDPVTPDAVHASFLVFPELVRTASKLLQWIPGNIK
jgi:hypothetical protein